MQINILDIQRGIRKPLSKRGVVVMRPKKGKGAYRRKQKNNRW